MDSCEAVVQSSLTPLAFSLVMAAVVGAAFQAYRQRYLAYWAAYWAMYVVAWPTVAASFATVGAWQSFFSILSHALGFGARGLFILGTIECMEWKKPTRRQMLAIAVTLLAFCAAGEPVRIDALAGRLPGWATLPFRTFFLGGIAQVVLAVEVLRERRAQRVPRLVLSAAIILFCISDAWDLGAEWIRGVQWTESVLGLRISLFVSQLTDALCGAGMLVAAVGTERERAERALAEVRNRDEQLDRVKQMEVLGRLAGGLAHDFNNLLTVIVSSLGFLQQQFGPGDEGLLDVQSASLAADRASALTRKLLTFARHQRPEPRVVDPGEVLSSLEPMLAAFGGGKVSRRLRIAPGLWPVNIDPGQLEQAIVNLVVNAHDAMPTGGTLSIDAENVSLRETRGGLVPAGDWVQLSVEDTGEGICESVQKRIFEPFFTTKPAGKGTGLGLATVFGVVQQAGGHVSVKSARGQGARFTLWLPRQ